MTALLERLNASRRFARSVYAPHKLALRQGVPSVLRAVGVTAPILGTMSASRSVAPRVIAAAVPTVTRDAVPPGAARRPNTSAVANPAALEPQAVTNLEPRAATNLESQGLANLEPQDVIGFEAQDFSNLEPQDFGNLELPLADTAFSAAPLEVAAPIDLAPSEPMLELDDTLVANPPLEQGIEAPPTRTFFDQPVADPAPIRVQPSVPLEPSAPANAPAVRVAETQMIAAQPGSPPISRASSQAKTAPSEPIGQQRELAQQSEPVAQTLPEPSRVADASAMPETLAAAPAQPLGSQAAIAQPVSLERQFVAPDLEVLQGVPATSEPIVNNLFTNDPFTNKPVPSEAVPLEVPGAPPVPEVIAPSFTAPVTLEVAAPIVASPPAADQAAPSPDPLQTKVRGRVVEEFQARPPRNMPPRNLNLRAAEPEAAPEVSPSEMPPSQMPSRSPEEWARLLRQRFAQPGDEAFNDALVSEPPATLNAVALEAAPSDSNPPVAAKAANLEPSAVVAATALDSQALPSSTPAVTTDSSEGLSASIIRERSQAALQAIPEDMSQRTPRDWGLALIRRYTSADEAAAIGIEAYRDPNDPTPIPAAVQAPPSESVRTITPRVVSPVPIPSSIASNVTVSSVTVSNTPIASASLEPVVSPGRRFVAPRMAVSSTAPSPVRPSRITPALIAPVQSEPARAQPAPPHRSAALAAPPAPLEQLRPALDEAAAQIPASLEPSRPASSMWVNPQPDQPNPAVDAQPQTTLETEDFAAPEPGAFGDAQLARTASRPASDAPQNSDVAASPDVATSPDFSASMTPQDMARPDALAATPTLEPVSLSGATRRFLEPLVGFDPNEVSVYTGEGASRLTRDLRADAAAQDGAVLLPEASNLETPAQLGLLAHELIHAAQQQQQASSPLQPAAILEPTTDSMLGVPLGIPAAPQSALGMPAASLAPQSALERARPFESVSRRFVPAVGSSDTRSAEQAPSAAQPSSAVQPSNAVRQSSAPMLEGISSFASEERHARAAEARVMQIARAGPLSSQPVSAATQAAPSSWNGLPAPWESLPSFESPSNDDGVVSLIGAGLSPEAWGGSATTTTISNPSGYGGSVSSSSSAPSSSALSSSAPSSAAPTGSASSAAQAAEIGRELPAEGGGAASAAPDLEQLAKQVYDVLKRRLQSDRRRGGL